MLVCGLRAGCDIKNAVKHVVSSVELWVLRMSHLSDVWVRLLRVDASVVLHVPKGVGHVPSSAAVVLFDTVHQVLGTEVNQLTGFLGQLALQGPGRAEGPTGATGALSE